MADELKIDSAKLDRDVRRTLAKLAKLKPSLERKVLRKAMRAGLAPVVKALKANATRGESKALSRSMGQQTITERATGGLRIVGVAGQSRKKAKKLHAAHIHLVDQDTKPHTIPGAAFINRAGELIRGDLEHPGTTGDEFVEHTAQQTQKQSLRLFADKAASEVEKEMAKLGTK